jgi:hypothetical protein
VLKSGFGNPLAAMSSDWKEWGTADLRAPEHSTECSQQGFLALSLTPPEPRPPEQRHNGHHYRVHAAPMIG